MHMVCGFLDSDVRGFLDADMGGGGFLDAGC